MKKSRLLMVDLGQCEDVHMQIAIPSAGNVELFIGASLVLLLVPGPAVLYLVGRSVEQGRVAGLVSIVGIHMATLVHVAAASLGLSALLASSVLAFGVVKYAGAAYLIWLGLKKLLGRAETADGVIFRSMHILGCYATASS
jgi:threonine/homoserine/homoserine lactone efflux protein